jgi:excisionase family DNA binding protein
MDDIGNAHATPRPVPASTATDYPLLLKIEAAAQRLQISRSAIYNLIHRGELHTVHIGSSVRVLAVELDVFVARISA